MGPLQLFFVCTCKGLLIYESVTQEGAFGFGEVSSFWILHSCPLQEETLFLIFAPKHYYLIVLFSVSLHTPAHPVYFEILLILERLQRVCVVQINKFKHMSN